MVMDAPAPPAPAATNGLAAPVDHWRWVAHLADGTRIEEDAAGTWLKVPADRVVTIELVPLAPGRAPLLLDVPPGAVAWCARLRRLSLIADTGEQVRGPSVTILRWTAGERGIWCYVRDDGLISVTDREIPSG